MAVTEIDQVQRFYNAIVARGTRSVPTFGELAREARREAAARVSLQTWF